MTNAEKTYDRKNKLFIKNKKYLNYLLNLFLILVTTKKNKNIINISNNNINNN